MQPAPFIVPFESIRAALGSLLASTVAYEMESSPFAINATLGEWLVSPSEIRITVESGTLIDLDKGSFPLSGIVASLRPEGQLAPLGLRRPGALSELQQAGLLDAITTYLNRPGLRYRVDTAGLHVTAGDRTFDFTNLE